VDVADATPAAGRTFPTGFRRVSGGCDQLPSELRRYDAIRLDPNANAYVGRGNVNRDQGNLNEAFSDYNEGIQLDPNKASAYKSSCTGSASSRAFSPLPSPRPAALEHLLYRFSDRCRSPLNIRRFPSRHVDRQTVLN
jgi:tetratricopeptide (TPR) repeat protein